jgi:hypothetical protein
MKITKKILRELKIYNPYMYAGNNPYIDYRAQDFGRGGHGSAAWMITYPGRAFKEAFWRDNGSLAITVFNIKDKKEKLLEAQEKFKSIFHNEEFLVTPFGTWMDKIFVEKRNKELELQLKELKVNPIKS